MADKTAKISDFNLHKTSTKDLEEHISRTIDFGGNMMVVGRRGSGKTTIAKDIIEKSGYREVYLNLSVMERPDIGGFPNFHSKSERKFIEFLLPDWYEPLIEGNQPCVALLDEVDKVESSLNAPLLELSQFRTMNGRKLNNLKAVIMTGNLQSEGGQRPSLPLLDRAEKYLMEPNYRQWLDWASRYKSDADGGGIHASITAYISDHPDDLFGDVDPGDVYADPSPRGWHNASKIINFGEKKGWSHDLISHKVAGCIGKKTGVKYQAYFDHYQQILPVVEKIMAGEKADKFDAFNPSQKIVACMIACARSARILDERKDNKKDKNEPLPGNVASVGKFLSKNADPEMILISLRSQIGLQRVIDHSMDDNEYWDKILKDIAQRINS